MSNSAFAALTWLTVVTHVAVGIFAWRRGSTIPFVPMLNFGIAFCIAFYWGQRLIAALVKGLTWYGSDQVWLAYALLVCIVSVLALTGRVAWNGLHWTVFGVHAVASVAAALFATFFKMNRLM